MSVNDCGPHVVPSVLGGHSIDGFVFLIPVRPTEWWRMTCGRNERGFN